MLKLEWKLRLDVCTIQRQTRSKLSLLHDRYGSGEVIFMIIIFYNITKARRALWLANSACTICPWLYAADVLPNWSKARALWCSSIYWGLTWLCLASPQHFDHCDDPIVVDKSTDLAKINICLDKWKHRLGLESAHAALCKWAVCTRQIFLSKAFTKSLNPLTPGAFCQNLFFFFGHFGGFEAGSWPN